MPDKRRRTWLGRVRTSSSVIRSIAVVFRRRVVASRSPTGAPAGVEPGAGGRDVVLHGDGPDSADHLDEVVNPGEDAIAVVLCHVADVLHEMRRGAGGGQASGKCRNVDGLVAHRDTQGVLDFRGDFMPVELFGAEQRVDLAVVRVGVFQDCGDDMGLIGGVDRGRGGHRRRAADRALRRCRRSRTCSERT